MKVAFVHDDVGYTGGARLSVAEFERAAPDPLVKVRDADTVVVHNCATFGPGLVRDLQGKRVVWFHHDLSPHVDRELKGWLDAEATHMFCSPLQRDAYGLDGELVPPAVDLDRFRQVSNGHREGAVSVGSWQNEGKGQQSLVEFAREHGLTVFGDGPFVPSCPEIDYRGPLDPGEVPGVLAHYRTFVHLPWVIEPFGRCVVEAWASGCALVVNRLVGALWWIQEAPDALETAAQRFWEVVLSAD